MRLFIRFDLFVDADLPLAGERTKGDGSWTFRQNFTGWWSTYTFLTVLLLDTIQFLRLVINLSCLDILKDDILKKDMVWMRSVHPNGYTVERSAYFLPILKRMTHSNR